MIAFLVDNWPYILAGLIACACAIGAMMHNAPVGWEDASGFHRGEWHEGDE